MSTALVLARKQLPTEAPSLHPIKLFLLGVLTGSILVFVAVKGISPIANLPTEVSNLTATIAAELKGLFEKVVDSTCSIISQGTKQAYPDELSKEIVQGEDDYDDWTSCLPRVKEIHDLFYKEILATEDESIKRLIFKAMMETDDEAAKTIVENIRKQQLRNEIANAIRDYDAPRAECLVEFLDDIDAEVQAPASSKDVYMERSTLLHWAAFYNADTCAEVLLDAEATVDIKNGEGNTALHVAAKYGSKSVVSVLKRKGTDIEAKDAKNRTPLCLASLHGHHNLVRFLIAKEANYMSICDIDRLRPIHYAASNGHIGVIQVLAEKGVNINAKDLHFRSPVYLAAENGHVDTVKVLMASGARVDDEDVAGWNALQAAASKCHYHVAKLLVANGILNTNKSDGRWKAQALVDVNCHCDRVRMHRLLSP